MRNTNSNLYPMKGTSIQYEGINNLELLPDIVEECLAHEQLIKTNKKIEYFNVSCAFDIESTSFYQNEEKQSIMYEWTLGLNNAIVAGRTWKEFIEAINYIAKTLHLSLEKRLIIYVHNLAFEFQFMRKWFTWDNVFSVNDRKPVYALTSEGIEFRCSYILSGYGLASLGNQLKKYPVQKMVGDLDYSLMRHSQTPLTAEEWKYCENDVRVVMSYIQECIERDGNITKIPLTKTGYVRTYCRNACMYEGGHKKSTYKFIKYQQLMKQLTITAPEYEQLKRAFQGGFTHANAFYSGKIMYNVGSFDFTSSYPAVMVAEQFPMSKAEIVKITNKQEFEKNIILYCCLFDVQFIGLEASTLFEHPLSKSRCWEAQGITEDNGRIVEASSLYTTITEQDYFILKRFYTWKSMRIGTFRRYKKGYLPTDFVKSILKLYSDKTTLKGVVGREEDYLRSKEMINSCYGMCVTDICRNEVKYDNGEWSEVPVDIESTIEKNNKSKRRFLFFAWGVWVTAYARRNLFTGIYAFGNDYIYSDTDSVKAINIEAHQEYINDYNDKIIFKLERALKFHGIPPETIRPKTIKGVEKVLGVWDFEGIYSRFKTLGAKRYMTEKNGELSITVSGVNKSSAVPYIIDKYTQKNAFDAFSDNLLIPAKATGKMTHTYLDNDMQGLLKDYIGNTYPYYEKSGVHLEGAEYSLSLAQAYVDYLLGIEEYTK